MCRFILKFEMLLGSPYISHGIISESCWLKRKEGDCMILKSDNGLAFYWALFVVLSPVAVMKTDLIISAERTLVRTVL